MSELLQEKKEKAGVVHFVYEDRVFVPIMPFIQIGKQTFTALELCLDPEAQWYLVQSGCIGTVIKEIE